MEIDFPSEIDEINDTDFDILRCLYQNGSLWKMEVTRRINRRRGNTLLDLKQSITKQAVAKRIERLHELDYIESSIISARKDGGTRFILGYSVNGKGERLLFRCTKLVLRDVVSEALIKDGSVDEESAEDYLSIYSELSGRDVNKLEEFVLTELNSEQS